MLTLALDTSSAACSVALVEVTAAAPARALARAQLIGARRHGEVLAPAIHQVFAESRHRPADLAAIVAGLGPGPFTSLRVGVMTAAAMGQALGVPAYGICSLDGLVDARPGRTAAVGDARRHEVYWAVYEAGARVAGPQVGPASEVVAAGIDRAVGDGALGYPEVFGALAGEATEARFPDPVRLVELAASELLAAVTPGPLVPLYLRRPDAAPPHRPKAVTT